MCCHEGCGPFWSTEEHHGHHWGHPSLFSPCCCPEPLGFRRFWTKEEKIKVLEDYLASLRKEAQAVEEKLRKLREE